MGLHSPVVHGREPAAGLSARALIVWSVWLAATCTALWYVPRTDFSLEHVA